MSAWLLKRLSLLCLHAHLLVEVDTICFCYALFGSRADQETISLLHTVGMMRLYIRQETISLLSPDLIDRIILVYIVVVHACDVAI